MSTSIIARRNTLLSSSSLGLAAVASAALLGVALTPSSAKAANECGNPDTNAGAADVFACPSPPTVYANGIVYTSNGNLTLNVGTGVVSFGTGGLVATAGNLGDNLTVTTSATNLSTSSSGASIGTRAPAVIDLQSQAGNVTVGTAGNIAGVSTFVEYAIRARSSGAGNIALNSTGGNISVGTAAANAGIAAIFASSNGGDITINKTVGDISGRLYGVQARTTSGGVITIETAGNVSLPFSSGPSTSVAAIEAISGAGNIAITVGGTVSNGSPLFGAAGIITQTAGNVTVTARNISGGGSVMAGPPLGWAMRSSGAGGVTLTLQGPALTPTTNPLTTTSKLLGGVNFSGLAGPAVINLTAGSEWEITRDSVFGDGDDVVNIASGGFLHLLNFGSQLVADSIIDRYTLNFAGGDDEVVNQGLVLVGIDERYAGGQRLTMSRYEGELRLENLTTFENTGTIFLGAYNFSPGTNLQRTVTSDGWHDDILAMPGAHFIGGDGSRIVLDVLFNGVGQDQCDASLRNTDGDLPGADCMDLSGGSVTGQTELSVHDEFPGERGAYNPEGTVIIDVSGGTAEPDAFVLAADSTNYSPRGGGVIDKGLFVYALGYDEDVQQFKLYGVASDVSQQYPLLAQAANELWRTGTGNVFDRRSGGMSGAERDGDFGGGVWVRATGASVERDVQNTVTAGTTVIDFDNSYAQRNIAVTAGADLLGGEGGDAEWGFGVMLGYNRGEVEFDQSSNTANLEGAHAGVYGSFTAGPFFVDAVLNSAWLTLDSDAPVLNLAPAGTLASTTVTSLGGQVEAGWRFAIGPAALEPLASISYVKTSLEDMAVPSADPLRVGGDIQYEDATSLRGGLGARISMTDLAPRVVPISLSLTTRAIQESEGVTAVQIGNIGPVAASASNALEGTFSEVVGVVSIANEAGTAAGVLNLGGVFGDDYRSVSASLGLRYQW